MIRYALPLGIFVALAVVLGIGLGLNPREVPSPFVGKPLPDFELPQVRDGDRRLSRADLSGKVALVNFWATWCEGCRLEHPLLMRIARDGGVPIYGVNYKDERAKAIDWLERHGDPYVASGYDVEGGTGIDLGVYGLPETFVVGADGIVAYKHIGALSEQDWQDKLLPIIRSLGGGG